MKGRKTMENEFKQLASMVDNLKSKLYDTHLKNIKLQNQIARFNTWTWFDFVKHGIKKIF